MLEMFWTYCSRSLYIISVEYWSFILCVLGELAGLRESEEKLKQQQQESTRRENVLVMRLATKEHEVQDLLVRKQIATTWRRLTPALIGFWILSVTNGDIVQELSLNSWSEHLVGTFDRRNIGQNIWSLFWSEHLIGTFDQNIWSEHWNVAFVMNFWSEHLNGTFDESITAFDQINN